jgi:hypothetical protein
MVGYHTHRIYCDLNYASLISIAADYFESNGYLDYFGENKFRNNNEFVNYESDSATFLCVAARSLVDVSGSISVKSQNLKGKLSRQEISSADLPRRVIQKFKNLPNVLEVNIHRNWYPSQYVIVTRISEKLKSAGYDTYDGSFNGELLGAFDAIMSEEERVKLIDDLILEHFSRYELPSLDLSAYHEDFKFLISNLTPDGIKALKTAEMLKDLCDTLPDYSPIVIEYCKIVEIELYDKVLKILKKEPFPSEFNVPKALKKLKSFISSPDKKSIELGTFANILISATSPDNMNNILATRLVNHVESLPFKRSAKDLVKDLFDLTRNYRNKAAHKAILSHQDMIDCRKFVLGKGDQLGLLSRIVTIG